MRQKKPVNKKIQKATFENKTLTLGIAKPLGIFEKKGEKLELVNPLSWAEVNQLFTQLRKQVNQVYNKTISQAYTFFVKNNFNSKQIDKFLSDAIVENAKELGNAYIYTGIRQKIKSNLGGAQGLRNLKYGNKSLPTSMAEFIPFHCSEGLKTNVQLGENGNDFIIYLPLKYMPKPAQNIDKYQPWKVYDFPKGPKWQLGFLCSTLRRKKLNYKTLRQIQALEAELYDAKQAQDAKDIANVEERIKRAKEYLDDGTQAEIMSLLNKTYKYKLTSLEITRGRKGWEINLSIKKPIIQRTPDKKIIAGIDRGSYFPMVVALSNSLTRKNIFGGEIKKFYTSARIRQRQMTIGNCGKRLGRGIKNKFKYIRLKKKNQNFIKNVICRWCKTMIRFLIKENAGILVMEDLSNFNRDDDFFSIMNVHFPFYRVQKRMEDLCKRNCIEVRYVPPEYTSQICSECGHHNSFFTFEYRKNNNFPMFECKNCRKKISPDYNSARNLTNLKLPEIQAEIRNLKMKTEKIEAETDIKIQTTKIFVKNPQQALAPYNMNSSQT